MVTKQLAKLKLIIVFLSSFLFFLWKDKFALEAVPYKEEIEDLKMQLVKTDLEKKADAKEFEKEYVCLRSPWPWL